MTEVLYDVPTGVISLLLLAAVVATMTLGHRIGQRAESASDEAAKEHVNAIQGSILGILALLLGFTFSLALQRFDNRSEAVADEANAIGTALLRIQLLPPAWQPPMQAEMNHYLDRPRRGLTQVSQHSLLDLQAASRPPMGAASGAER